MKFKGLIFTLFFLFEIGNLHLAFADTSHQSPHKELQTEASVLINIYPDSAITILKGLLQIENGEDQISFQTENHILLSAAYRIKGNLVLALDQAQSALRISETNNYNIGISDAYSSIGQTYERQEDFEKALIFHKKALKINEEIGINARIAKSYSNLGNIYGQLGSYEESLGQYHKSLEYLNEEGNETEKGIIYGNIGYVYLIQGDTLRHRDGGLKNALAYYEKSIENTLLAFEIFKKTDNFNFTLNAKSNLGLAYVQVGKLKLAEEICMETYLEAKANSINPMTRDACFCLYRTYKEKGEKSKALEFFENYIQLRDSLLNMDEQRKMLEKELSFNYQKQADLNKKLHEQELQMERALADKNEKRKNLIITAVSIAIVIIFIFLIFLFTRYKIIRQQNKVINEQKRNLTEQKEIVDEKNTEILDSISYARRLQAAILPSLSTFKQKLPASFILYLPKDIVAGDFYWMKEINNQILFAVADCTGHGVPGAMVSVICNGALNRAVGEFKILDPGKILDKVREIVIDEFDKSDEIVSDGMDIALCSLQNNVLKYAGAHNPLWLIKEDANEVTEIKADKQPIGKFSRPTKFNTQAIKLDKGDTLYIFTDGFSDQFGGEKGKKYKSNNFKKLLLSIQDQPIEDQKISILKTFENWKGSLEQLDDICVIGVKI